MLGFLRLGLTKLRLVSNLAACQRGPLTSGPSAFIFQMPGLIGMHHNAQLHVHLKKKQKENNPDLVVQALKRPRQEDQEFNAGLGYLVRSCLKI